MKTGSLGFVLLGFVAVAQCQAVQVGPVDPNYCEKIQLKPNLVVEEDAEISGRITDSTGAPFQNSRVELRRFVSPTEQIRVEATTTDLDGRFQLHSVKSGTYRLVASPTRAFQQPHQLHCGQKHCNLSIGLQPNPTDMPDSQCPVR